MLKRKVVITLLSATLLFSSLTTAAYGEELIHEEINVEKLAGGVTQKSILRFTEGGWANINVMYVDLKDPNIGLELLQSSTGLQTKETLSTMTKAHNNVIGAINGDFFYYTSPDSPMGIMVKDGKMISSSPIEQNFASLFVYNTNTAFTDYIKLQVFINNKNKSNTLKVDAVNKYTWEYRMITLVDRNWGKTSPGATDTRQDIVEAVIVDNKVVEIRQGQPAVDIPENGYVLFAAGEKGSHILNAMEVGDEIAINYSHDITNIKLAMGAGTQLLKNGEVVPFVQPVTGNHPRTAVGITKEGTQLIMVTVDGRNKSFKGMDGQKLAALMLELGSNEAVLLDGGGSTTMLARSLGTFAPQLVNYPSDGSQRRIINGLAIVSKATAGSLKGIITKLDYPATFIGLGREIIVRAFDQNDNPVEVNNSDIKYSLISGKGRFVGNKFIPEASGDVIIGINYKGISSQVNLRVYEELAGLDINPKKAQLAFNKSLKPQVIGIDSNGYRVPIANEELQWKDPKGLGSFSNGSYTAGNVGDTTIIEASYGGKKAYTALAIGLNQITIDDFENFKVSFLGFPAEVTGTVVHEASGQIGKGIALEYDFTNSDASRAAYIVYDDGGISIADKQDKIGVSVFANEASPLWIRGRIKDAEGNTHVMEFSKGVDWTGWKYLEANLPEGIVYPMTIDRLYVVETDASQKYKGKLIFDDLKTLKGLEIPRTSVEEKIIDPLNRVSAKDGVKILIHSGIKTEKATLLDRIISNKLNSLINSSYEYALFTEEVEARVAEGIKKPTISATAEYSKIEYKNSLFIKLDNRGGGLRQTNHKQYSMLKNDIEASTQKNVFILLPKPIWGENGFKDQMEADLFAEILTGYVEAGKRIFVLYEGEVKADVVDGVRYIGTGSYDADINKNPKESYPYVEFNITDTEVTYQIKSIFQ